MTDVQLPRFDVLSALSEYTCTAKWNLFVLYIGLILVIPYKITTVFKSLRSDDLRAQNFEAHYVMRTSVLLTTDSPEPIKSRVLLWPLYKTNSNLNMCGVMH